jgi:hypothetical protein
MLKKLILGSALSLSACGSNESLYVSRHPQNISFDEYLTSAVDAPIRPHFVEFIEFCKLSSQDDTNTCAANIGKLKNVRLKSGPIDESNPTVIGLCEIGIDRTVTIRSDFFDHRSIAFKALVWHELGHCLLDLDHIDGVDNHIMNSYLPSNKALQSSWAYFVKDLFESKVKLSLLSFLVSDSIEDSHE